MLLSAKFQIISASPIDEPQIDDEEIVLDLDKSISENLCVVKGGKCKLKLHVDIFCRNDDISYLLFLQQHTFIMVG